MTHPTREQWISYLHDETHAGERGALAHHLNECIECRAQVTAWQETRRRLDTWKLAPPRSRRTLAFAWPRWAVTAAAAAVVLMAGFALGRSAGPSRTELASLRAEVQELKAGLGASLEAANGAETRKQLLDFANELNTRFAALQTQQAVLRRELETVAVLTEAGFNQTANRLVELASASQPDTNQ